jgi:hypothetical protein
LAAAGEQQVFVDMKSAIIRACSWSLIVVFSTSISLTSTARANELAWIEIHAASPGHTKAVFRRGGQTLATLVVPDAYLNPLIRGGQSAINYRYYIALIAEPRTLEPRKADANGEWNLDYSGADIVTIYPDDALFGRWQVWDRYDRTSILQSRFVDGRYSNELLSLDVQRLKAAGLLSGPRVRPQIKPRPPGEFGRQLLLIRDPTSGPIPFDNSYIECGTAPAVTVCRYYVRYSNVHVILNFDRSRLAQIGELETSLKSKLDRWLER